MLTEKLSFNTSFFFSLLDVHLNNGGKKLEEQDLFVDKT